jgi:hypothetical protein
MERYVNMNELPVTRLMFSVASNDVEWIGTRIDLVMNSLRELHRYDQRHHTEVLSQFVEDNSPVYNGQMSTPFTNIKRLRLIRSLWWEWHEAIGVEPGNILPIFVVSLQRAYPIVLSLPANMQQYADRM